MWGESARGSIARKIQVFFALPPSVGFSAPEYKDRKKQNTECANSIHDSLSGRVASSLGFGQAITRTALILFINRSLGAYYLPQNNRLWGNISKHHLKTITLFIV